MAYNPAMYNSYGQYGNSYGQYPQQMQQAYSPVPASVGMVWVDGEAEAKGKQIPSGATQFAMWDINEPIVYVKSLNPMGIPNPLRKIRYQMDEMQMPGKQTSNLMSGEEEKEDTTQYVRKDELQSMKDEIMQAIRESKTESSATRRSATKGE